MATRVLGLVFAGLLLGPVTGNSTVVGGTFSFTATNFTPCSSCLNVGAPIDPFSGTFSVSFDNAADIFGETSGISGSFSYTPGGPLSFTYSAAEDSLLVGVVTGDSGIPSSETGIVFFGRNDFGISIANFSTAPTFASVVYTSEQVSGRAAWVSRTFSSSPSPVPEPGTFALLGLGLLGLGLSRRRLAA